jgi:hypothetical protein
VATLEANFLFRYLFLLIHLFLGEEVEKKVAEEVEVEVEEEVELNEASSFLEVDPKCFIRKP